MAVRDRWLLIELWPFSEWAVSGSSRPKAPRKAKTFVKRTKWKQNYIFLMSLRFCQIVLVGERSLGSCRARLMIQVGHTLKWISITKHECETIENEMNDILIQTHWNRFETVKNAQIAFYEWPFCGTTDVMLRMRMLVSFPHRFPWDHSAIVAARANVSLWLSYPTADEGTS